MARRFEFQKKELELDIEGRIVKLPFANNTMQRLKEKGEELIRYGEDMKAASGDVGAIDKATDFILDCVDDVFGEGSVDAILNGREIGFADAANLFWYITEEAKEHFLSVNIPGQFEPATMNRAQRRQLARESAEMMTHDNSI